MVGGKLEERGCKGVKRGHETGFLTGRDGTKEKDQRAPFLY